MPCVPANILVSLSVSSTPCLYNTAVVSWNASQGAVQYSVSAWSSRGNATCRSSDLHCTLNVTCGSNYTVEVTAINGNCSSPPSERQTFSSASGSVESIILYTHQIQRLCNAVRMLLEDVYLPSLCPLSSL